VGSDTLAEAGVPRATLARLAPTQDTQILTEVLDAEATDPAGTPSGLHRNRWGTVTKTPADAPASSPRRVDTGDCEWYTPPEVMTLVKEVLGIIDVDPASCETAQQVVGARTYYTREDDGLRHPWVGTVFCNPPSQMPAIARFCGKLLDELDAGHTTAAILLTNAVTDTAWFHRVAPQADALCFTDGRIPFVHATRDGLRPCQGQAVLYFGPQVARFCEVFGVLGLLMQVIGAKVAGPQLALAEAPANPDPQPTPVTREQAGTLIQAVYLMVQQLQPCPCAVVAKALGKPLKRVHQALHDLLKQGKVRKAADKTYQIVDAASVEVPA
jgi:hypothetical protein